MACIGFPHKVALLVFLIMTSYAGSAYPTFQEQAGTQGTQPRRAIPTLLEDKSRQGDIKLGKDLNYAYIPSVDALADLSDVVVVGKAVASRSFPCQDMDFVCTEFRFKVRQVLWGAVPADRRGKDHISLAWDKKTGRPADENTPPADQVVEFRGPALDEIVVTQPGGTVEINGRRVIATVTDQSLLQRNHEYVLFLNWIPDTRRTSWGSEMYQPYGGLQAVIEVIDGQLRPLVSDPTHPIRAELERSFNNDLARLASHFVERRKPQ